MHYSRSSFNSQSCGSSTYQECTFSRRLSSFPSSAVFNFCTFDTLSSEEDGGAISFSQASQSLTLEGCNFRECTSSAHGGAVFVDSSSSFTAKSTTFAECVATNFGGAIAVWKLCVSSSISFCSFVSCHANHGGAFVTYLGPSSFLSSTRIFSCTAEWVGGGFYHEGCDSDFLTVIDCLFAQNSADYSNGTYVYYYYRGGGAFEDLKKDVYPSKYSFSFFMGNKAPNGVGNDISIYKHGVTANDIFHCFTMSFHSIWNGENEGYVDWLPQGSIYFVTSTTEGANETIDNNSFTYMHTLGSYL